MKIEVYGRKQCPWCDKVRDLITNNGLEYTYTDVHSDLNGMQRLIESDLKTLPQVWIDGKHVGGYEDTRTFIHFMRFPR